MDKHTAAIILFAIGIGGILFALFRIYYVMWKVKREREELDYRRKILKIISQKKDSDSQD